MKTAITIMMILALAAVSGCHSNSSRGGSRSKGEGFKIAIPNFDTDIRQGEVRAVTISLQRGAYFRQDVRLRIEASHNISIEPTNVLVGASESPEIQVRIATTANTPLSTYRISVTGTPETGKSTSTTFSVKVVAP